MWWISTDPVPLIQNFSGIGVEWDKLVRVLDLDWGANFVAWLCWLHPLKSRFTSKTNFVNLLSWISPQEGRLIQRNCSSQARFLSGGIAKENKIIKFFPQSDMKTSIPWFWSWGWRPHLVTVQGHWPSSSCWVSWATGFFLSAVSAP